MGFFSRKKKEKIKEVKTRDCSLKSLKDKFIEEKETLEDLTDLKKLINNLLDELGKARSALLKLVAAKQQSDVSKALLVGINNSRRQVYNTINPFLSPDKPRTYVELIELMYNTNKLLDKAKKVGSKHGSKISSLFKDEMKAVGLSLESVTNSFSDLKKVLDKRGSRISKLNSVISEVNEFESLINKCNQYKDKNNELIEKQGSLNKSKEVIQEKLARLKASKDLEKAMALNDRVRRLKARINALKTNFLKDYGVFSRAAKKYVKDNEYMSLIVKSLEKDPLKTIKDNLTPINNLINGLIRSLESDGLGIKPKQIIKSLRVLRSLNPQSLLDDYESILSEIKSINVDESVIKKVENEEYSLIKINNELVHLKKLIKGLSEERVRAKGLINPRKEKLEVVASEAAGSKINIKL